jgi:hypothetical protein
MLKSISEFVINICDVNTTSNKLFSVSDRLSGPNLYVFCINLLILDSQYTSGYDSMLRFKMKSLWPSPQCQIIYF